LKTEARLCEEHSDDELCSSRCLPGFLDGCNLEVKGLGFEIHYICKLVLK